MPCSYSPPRPARARACMCCVCLSQLTCNPVLSKQPTRNCWERTGHAHTLEGKVLEPILARDYVQGSHAGGGLSVSCVGRTVTEEGRKPKGDCGWIKKFLTVKKRLPPRCEPGPLERSSPPQLWTWERRPGLWACWETPSRAAVLRRKGMGEGRAVSRL